MRVVCLAMAVGVCLLGLEAPAAAPAKGTAAKAARPPAAGAGDAALPHAGYIVEQLVKPSAMHGVHGLAFGPDGALYGSSLTGHAIYRIDVATGAVTTHLGPPRATSDDLAFAPDGTLAWTGGSQGAVFARGRDGKVRTIAENLPGVNAINFTKDGRLFFTRIFGGDALLEADLKGGKPPRVVAEKLGGLNAFQIAPDNTLYGPLFFRDKIVRVDIETGTVTDVATGIPTPSAVRIGRDGALIALAYHQGDVYRIDPNTGDKEVIASLPPPIDNLAVGKDGTLYVSSTAFNGITAIDPTTREMKRIVWGGVAAPGFLKVLAGEVPALLAADSWGPRTIDVASGVPQIIKRGQGVAGATGIAVQGDTYILSNIWPAGVVQVIDRVTGKPLANLTNFGVPYDVLPLADGFLVAEYAVGRITKISGETARTRTTYAWDLEGPVGLADDGDGGLFVSENTAGRISRVDPATNERRTIIDGLDAPEGLARAADGRLIVAEVGQRRVLAVEPATGRATILADKLAVGFDVGDQVPAPFLPTGVAAAPDGVIYVSGDVDNVIYRLTPPKP